MTKGRLLLVAVLPLVVALIVALSDGSGSRPAPAGHPDRVGLLAGGTTSVPAGFTLPPATPSPVTTAITYAFAQLGKRYSETVDGGVGPDDYDCSGLVQQAYAAAGIALPRTTFTQYEVGQPVARDHIAPGDLIFIPGSDPGADGAPGHVAMAIGSGLIIQAPFTGEKVQINPLASISRQIVTIRRIVAPSPARTAVPGPGRSLALRQVLDLQRIGDDAGAVHEFAHQRSPSGPASCPAERYEATVPDSLTGRRLTAAMVASVFASEDTNCPITLSVYRSGQVRAGAVVPGAPPLGQLTLSGWRGAGLDRDRLTAHIEGRSWTISFEAAAFPGKAPAPADYGLS